MTPVTEGQAPPRRDGAAQRPARPRPDALGRRRARRRDGDDQGRLGPQAARCAAVDGVPGVRGVVRLGEAFARDPARQARAARGAAAVRGRRPCSASPPARRSAGALLRAPRARRAAARRPPRCSRSRPPLFALRGGELAAYHGVEHKAIAAYEADDDGRRATRPRSTTAAARTWWRRCSPPTSPARCCCAARVEQPGAAGRRRASRSRRPRAAVEVFAWCERHADTRARARAAPPGLRAPAR